MNTSTLSPLDDAPPIVGVDDLEAHLIQLIGDPNLPLNDKLFDDVELQLNQANTPPLIPRLLPKLTQLLPAYQSDPAVLVSLAIKLIAPLRFTDLLSVASTDQILQALRSPAPSANKLALTILHKAALSLFDVTVLASMTPLVGQLLVTWLGAPAVEVGEKARRVLGDLLDVDSPQAPPGAPSQANGLGSRLTNGTGGSENTNTEDASFTVRRKSPGQGALWAAIFGDRTQGALLHSLLAGTAHETLATRDDGRQQSLAQGRLLRILPRLITLDFWAVATNSLPPTKTFPEPSPDTARSDEGNGILRFAALDMIDTDDELMRLNLVDFWETLISITRISVARSPDTRRQTAWLSELLAEAAAADPQLVAALVTLPDRTVTEEADELKAWLRQLLPGRELRVTAT